MTNVDPARSRTRSDDSPPGRIEAHLAVAPGGSYAVQTAPGPSQTDGPALRADRAVATVPLTTYRGILTMQTQPALPSFEIITIENASNTAAKRLRVYVAIDPDDMAQVDEVATAVITEHAGDNDVVMMFFHPSPAEAGKAPPEARAQYVRNGMKQGYIPKPLTNVRGSYGTTTRVKTPNGVITVESARQA